MYYHFVTCFVAGGSTCTQVSTACGSVNTLTSGQSVTIESQNFPSSYNNEICSYLFKGPSSGHSLKLVITSLNLPNCDHYLDIRNFAIGVESPIE